MRGSVSEVMRCLARCGGRRMSVLGRSILRIITAWSTLAATRGAVGDVVGARAAAATSARRAGDDQLALARPQRARRRRRARPSTRVGDVDRLGEVEDQPAHAAGERGVDAPAQLRPRLASSVPAHVDLVHDVVEPVLPERQTSPACATARRDWDVNMAGRSARRGTPSESVFPAPRARQACKLCRLSRRASR